VGVISSDTLALRSVPMHSNRSYPLQLRRLAVAVENVLKGQVVADRIEVYYFTWGAGFDGPQPLGFWRVGDRRIFLLRWDSGVMRTACDGLDNCTWGVYSGAHPQYGADKAKPIGYAIADILLTRGVGKIREQKFAGAIAGEAPAPFDYLIERLGQLSVTEKGAAKSAACRELWIYEHDRMAPNGLRTAAARWTREAACTCSDKTDYLPHCGWESEIYSGQPR
jgi:hypothetical protein